MMVFKHETVLLEESVDALAVKPDGIYVDATLGGGGHTALLFSKLTTGRLYAFDQDETAHVAAQQSLKLALETGRLVLVKDNFRNLRSALAAYGVTSIDGILYDLGVSSPQFDEGQRGFSYKVDARLDMRMDLLSRLTAYEVVNTYSYADLVGLFYRYGQEKFAKPIARKIEQARATRPIETTLELVDLIKAALPQKELKKKGHPAKQVFQALRIEVNDELAAARESLEQAVDLLAPSGRLAVISFHSLEDQLVKALFKEKATVNSPKGLPVLPDDQKPILKLITRKPIVPTSSELEHNHRARSAKLRVAEKE